jgi:hypothetical protein
MCSVIGPVAVNPDYTNKYRHIICEHCQVHTCFHGVMISVAGGVRVEPLVGYLTPNSMTMHGEPREGQFQPPAVVSSIF